MGRDPTAVRRTAQALVVVDGPVPTDLPAPVYGGSPSAIAATVEAYRELGLDELIIPDGLLGKGAEKLKALDTIRAIVKD